jgi:hypothetical protein
MKTILYQPLFIKA